jgi:hypothetical protein
MEKNMPEDKQKELPKIGYLFHHPNIGHANDKFRLDIYLSSETTELHFDVLRATFFILSPTDTVTTMKVLHPWKYEKSARVCPGPVVMEDRKGKKEEAFTFGGNLNIKLDETTTTCSLVSNAPIMHITGGMEMDELFVEEVEILLAQKRAQYSEHQEFRDRFCHIDPLKLYIACLAGLKDKVENFKHGDDHYHELLRYLETQERRLEAAGLLKEVPLTFDEILEE